MSLYLLGMDSVPDPVYNISGIIDDNYLVYCTNFSPDEIQTECQFVSTGKNQELAPVWISKHSGLSSSVAEMLFSTDLKILAFQKKNESIKSLRDTSRWDGNFAHVCKSIVLFPFVICSWMIF